MTKTYEPTPPRKTAFLGLGVMGHPMAGHLARAGHDVCVFNRTAAKAQAWAKEYGGRFAPTPREAAAGADFVFCCVGNDDDLRSVVLGEQGAFRGHEAGRDLRRPHHRVGRGGARALRGGQGQEGLHFVDAPVSGGQAGAVNGMLTVMCGGDPAPFDAMKPVAMAFSRAVTLVGRAAAPASWPRWSTRSCIAGLVQGLSEGIAFGQKAGLDMKLVLEVIGKGAAQSWQMDNRGSDDDRRQVRLRLRGRLDAQGPRPGARRGAPQRRAPAGDGAGRPVLRATCRRWAARAGTPRA